MTDLEQPELPFDEPMIEWHVCEHFYGCSNWAVFGDFYCPDHLRDPAFEIEGDK